MLIILLAKVSCLVRPNDQASAAAVQEVGKVDWHGYVTETML